jgi:D-threonate/D-erythronate kinase
MSLTIVADDLTGACDSGTLFAGGAPVPLTVWPQSPPPAVVRVVDTETRSRMPEDAARCVREAATAVPGTRYFKKIDSTLRGRIGAEVDALMDTIGAPGALVCPAFPAQGRVVLDRLLLVDGLAVAETALAADPDFPDPPARGGSSGSSVVELLRGQIDRALAWVPIDQVRESGDRLAARLRRLRGTVVIADAESESDLDALVDAALALDPPPLLVGSAGLARALAERLGFLAEPVALPAGRRWLIVAGSRHPATRRQVEAAREAGLRVLVTPETDVRGRTRAAARLAAETKRVLDREGADVVAITGGETTLALYQALGATRIDLIGAPAPGLAYGYLRAPAYPELAILTKAGGFGTPELFVSLAKEVVA